MASYNSADQLEKSSSSSVAARNDITNESLQRARTAGGHTDDRTQPALPVVHRSFANPAPLGLLSFATGIFLISLFGVHTRSVQTPNVMIAVLMFFGGVCQFISGIMEFVAGNTFGATVFPSYGAFNLSYSMIYLPGTGIIASYTDPSTGELSPELPQAIAFYLLAWFTLTVIFTISAMRSSWILFLDLAVLSVELLVLACGYMAGNAALLKGGNALGFVVAILSYWAGCAGLWAGDITPFDLPTFAMYKEKV